MNKKLAVAMLAVLTISVITACGADNAAETKGTEVVTETEVATETEAEAATEEAAAEGEFFVEFPEGFKQSADDPELYMHEENPESGANIVMSQGENDGTLGEITGEIYAAAVEQTLAAQGMEVTINMDEFSKVDIDGHNAIRIKMDYELNGVKVQQLQYLVEAGETIWTVAYTDINDGSWMEAYEESASTISFK